MRPRTLQIIAALCAALAFVLAFMAAGALVASALFMALGLGAVAWLVWSLLRGPRGPGRTADAAPSSRSS